MLFTVIIPTYNRADLIQKTIESVLNQTYKKFEIIVVDNSSTDNTREVLTPLIEQGKINFVQNSRNYERSKSRNIGMELAKGDFVTFLDSDDLMGPNCLQDVYDHVLKNEGKQLLFNRYAYVNQRGEQLFCYQPKINISFPFQQILVGNFLACIGVFISRKLYHTYRFVEDIDIIGSEDWLFWIEILHKEKDIHMIDKINSYIVDHENRTMKKIDPVALEKRVGIIKEALEFRMNIDTADLRRFEKYSAVLVANGFYEANSLKKSLQIISRNVLKYPDLCFNLRIGILVKNILFRFISNLMKRG